jgi:hypothetical protein
MPSDDDEVAQQQQQQGQGQGQQGQHAWQQDVGGQWQQPQQEQQQQQQQQKQQGGGRDSYKEYAALTTWLRMNLHSVSGGSLFRLLLHTQGAHAGLSAPLTIARAHPCTRRLTQPRTAKRVVLFVGEQDASTG